jgi:hypothetical protein
MKIGDLVRRSPRYFPYLNRDRSIVGIVLSHRNGVFGALVLVRWFDGQQGWVRAHQIKKLSERS